MLYAPVLCDAKPVASESIGKLYKQSGHDAAAKLGYDLVSGPKREARIEAWLAFARRHPEAWIFCWRGGERSEIAKMAATRGLS